MWSESKLIKKNLFSASDEEDKEACSDEYEVEQIVEEGTIHSCRNRATQKIGETRNAYW